MENSILQKISETLKALRKRTLWRSVLAGMMALVVFTTTYAMILPAITEEQVTYCGKEEHQHTDECYERVLICGYPDEEEGSAVLLGGGGTVAHALEAEVLEPAEDAEEPAPVEAAEEPAPVEDVEEPAPVENVEEPAPAEDAEEPAPAPVDGTTGHVHTDACYELHLVCGKEVHTH